MKKFSAYIIVLLAAANIIFFFFPAKQWLHMLIATNKPINQSRQMQAIKYTGFEKVMHFIQFDSLYDGNFAIIPLETAYTERFTEFYILSAMSLHSVFYAPANIILNSDFFDNRDISKMVLLHDDNIVVIDKDSLWSDNSVLLKAHYSNGIFSAQWDHAPYQHMRVYLFNRSGHYLTDIPVSANPYGDSLYNIEHSIELDDIPYFWTVSKMSLVNFSRTIGYVSH